MDDQTKKYLDEKFSKIDEKFDKVDERFDSLKDDMDQRFDKVNEKFDKVNERFDVVDHNLSLVLNLAEDMNEELAEKVADHEKRLKKLETPQPTAHIIRKR